MAHYVARIELRNVPKDQTASQALYLKLKNSLKGIGFLHDAQTGEYFNQTVSDTKTAQQVRNELLVIVATVWKDSTGKVTRGESASW